MLKKIICITLLCFSFLCAQTPEQIATFQKITKPNFNHQALEVFVGFWEATAKLYDGNDNVVYEEEGFCENKAVLGNRFVLFEHMFLSFHTAALLGYDNFLQHYTAAYIDSQATGIHHFIGEKVDTRFFLKGETAGFDGKLVNTVYLLNVKNANNYSMDVYYEIDGKPVKLMQIEFRRIKPGISSRSMGKVSQAVVRSFSDSGVESINESLRPLRPLVGQWKVESKIFDDSGNILRIDEGKASNRWVMMENFVLMVSQMGNYQSLSIMGYDSEKKSYVSASADNMGTSIYHCEGEISNEGAFKLYGTAMDYATGEKTNLMQVTKIQNYNHHTLEMYREKDKVELDVSTLKVEAQRIVK